MSYELYKQIAIYLFIILEHFLLLFYKHIAITNDKKGFFENFLTISRAEIEYYSR